jgi:Flp pilus assembly protein TadG
MTRQPVRRGRVTRDERGMVTAETAVVLPVLVAVTLAMVWLLTLGVAQMKVTDAAREAARALARGEPTDRAIQLAERAAPGAAVTIDDDEGMVVVTVRQEVSPPGGVLAGAFGSAEVSSAATALDEGPSSAAGP